MLLPGLYCPIELADALKGVSVTIFLDHLMS